MKYADVPITFILAHRGICEQECDDETWIKCYCGRLATGLHTATCKKFQKKIEAKITALYKAELKSKLIKELEESAKSATRSEDSK